MWKIGQLSTSNFFLGPEITLFGILTALKTHQECSAQPEIFFDTSACSRSSKFYIGLLKSFFEKLLFFLVWLILKKLEKKFHPKRYLQGHFHQYISPIWSLKPPYPLFPPSTKSASKSEQWLYNPHWSKSIEKWQSELGIATTEL